MPRTNIHNPIEAPSMRQSALYRWGMLFVIVFLLIVCGVISEFGSSTQSRWESYSSLVVPLMLLFNHLASAFKWRRSVSIVLHSLAMAWMAVGFIWIAWFAKQTYEESRQRQEQKSCLAPPK